MTSPTCIVPAALVCLAIVPLRAERGPSTPEERARVQRLAAETDQDPLKLLTPEGRWFTKWLDDVPDVTFGPEAPARWMEKEAKGDLRRVAIPKYMLSGVAHMLAHGLQDARKAPDRGVAVHQAALEGVVRAYEALRDKKPENRSAAFDEALAQLKAGTFPAFVAGLYPKSR
ncbi:hypothetical protein [Geothrix sp. PMB-07]|uniref:hypothetical protein n=1 Tax=Geothrix sp. PMB-07 TaxID=3068640 RepID=UPI002740AEDA|nr:hypothetical protein [Geothrix sp. PMB-07]WLT31637.1 hypothetical protein Q9293_18190 [Geothrix sp. PMB-07]